MASDILHIKDTYYFEIPKVLAPAKHADKADFPDVWIKLDDQFQQWEFERLYPELVDAKLISDDKEHVKHGWEHWTHEHGNHGKPFDVYMEEHADKLLADYQAWIKQPNTDHAGKSFEEYLSTIGTDEAKEFGAFALKYQDQAWRTGEWKEDKAFAGKIETFKADEAIKWSDEKLQYYNHHLSGKILIPQPFGELRNLYEAESGFAISKFMVVELVVAMILLVSFTWVARRIATGNAPKGRLWNLLEVFLVFIRDQIAAPAIGGGHDDHHDDHDHAHSHDAHGQKLAQGAHSIHTEAGEELSPHSHYHKTKQEVSDERRFTPVLWTIFFFVLGCNLFGILPWAGSPTASFNVTLALAGVTFACVVFGGMRKWGFLGFFANQVPSMDLPLPIAIVLKPMIFAIEIVGLLIKHGVLAIRLLANMVAGHLVILGIMGLAFGLAAALSYTQEGVPGWQWPLVAVIAVVGSTLFFILELFVAFLQAYVFTFLSALFIGASVHKH